jgi:hypothetical protein
MHFEANQEISLQNLTRRIKESCYLEEGHNISYTRISRTCFKLTLVVTFVTYIREVRSSNTYRDTDYLDCGISW